MHTRWSLFASLIALLLPVFAPGSAPVSPHPHGTSGRSIVSSAPAVPAQANERLLALEPFVGRWVAEGQLIGDRRYTTERRYAWTLDKRFLSIEQTMTIDSVTVTEGMMIGWDPAEEMLHFWSFASDGSFAEATERPAPGDNRWIFEGTTVGGTVAEWRVTTLLIDSTSFSLLVEIRNGGDFAPAMTVAYRKVQ